LIIINNHPSQYNDLKKKNCQNYQVTQTIKTKTAMVTVGAIDILVDRLSSVNDQVRCSTAIALGYLTFNKTAARILLSACRNTPGLYKKMMENIGKNSKISSDFLQDFRRAKIVGLPSQWYV
jgi:hypothetical protein